MRRAAFAKSTPGNATPMVGLGNRINEMEAWCRDNFHVDQWAQHRHSTKQPGQIAQDYARFYFMTGDDADLFRRKWAADSMKREPGNGQYGPVQERPGNRKQAISC